MQNPAVQKAAPGLYRLRRIIKGDPKAVPPVEPLIPVCAATWWAGVKTGLYPKPIKLSPRVTVWSAADIHEFIATAGGEQS